MPRHISIQLLINSSSKEIYVCFSKFFNNFMKKSRIEFPLSSVLWCFRLFICLNIDCSWCMCCCNLLLVFGIKIPYSADNVIASLRFYVPHIVEITDCCDTVIPYLWYVRNLCFYNMYRFLFWLLSTLKIWCALTLPYARVPWMGIYHQWYPICKTFIGIYSNIRIRYVMLIWWHELLMLLIHHCISAFALADNLIFPQISFVLSFSSVNDSIIFLMK